MLAAFQLLTEIPIFLGITRGWLDDPPTHADFAAWIAEAESGATPVDAEAVAPAPIAEALEGDAGPTGPVEKAPEFAVLRDSISGEELEVSRPSTDAVTGKPSPGTAPLCPAVVKTWAEAYTYQISTRGRAEISRLGPPASAEYPRRSPSAAPRPGLSASSAASPRPGIYAS